MKLKLLFVILCFGQFVLCQTKNEKEERVSLSEFPEAAQKVIKVLPEQCKRINFYKETDGEKHSFEAKFKYKGKRYSLEFSQQGIIEDLEITTKFKTLNESIKTKINAYFTSNYTKHKHIKIQQQYVYNSQIEPSTFTNNILTQSSNQTPNFEIIAEVKANKKRYLGEFTFNQTGDFLNFRTLKATSYEHVLY